MSTTDQRFDRRTAFAAVAILLVMGTVSLVPSTGLASTAIAERESTPQVTVTSPVNDTDDGTNETTQDTATESGASGTADTDARHVNPRDYTAESNLTKLRGRLLRDLVTRLGRSSGGLAEGSYELAHDQLGTQYRIGVARYVDVATKTEDRTDEQLAPVLREAGDEQRELVAQVEEYRRLYDQYRQAKQAGNQRKATKIAKQLLEVSKQINQTNRNVTDSYAQISRLSTFDLSNASNNISTIQEEVTTKQRDIRRRELVQTRLRVDANASRISFTNPVELTGELRTNNGSAIENATVVVAGDEVVGQTRTDANGTFWFVYRPVQLPTNATELRVVYRPQTTSPYVTSNATQPVRVEQVRPTVLVNVSPQTATYGDSMEFSGSVVLGNQSIQDVPLTFSVGSWTVGESRSNERGQVESTAPLPADVPDGERSVRARIPMQGRAIDTANATTTVEIRPTSTSITSEPTQLSNDSVRIRGRLTTSDRTPLANRRVALVANGMQLRTTKTGLDGRFNVTMATSSLPRPPEGGNRLLVDVSFDGVETNLRGSSTRVEVVVERADPAVTGPAARLQEFSGALPPILFPVVAVVISVGAVLVYRRRGDNTTFDNRTEDESPQAVESTDHAVDESTGYADQFDRTLLEAARRLLDDGQTNAAVVTAYGALRNDIASSESISVSYTSQNFYRACRRRGIGEQKISTLEFATEQFQLAAFSPTVVDRATAEDVIDSVAGCLE